MGDYAVPLPLGNFNMSKKETRRLELWENRKAVWSDHLEQMDEAQEKNKEWKNSWWTVDEDMFTYVMEGRLEELIEQKLNQEFLTEGETRQNKDSASDEEMTSATEDTDDDSEPNNERVNNYLDSVNMAMNLEPAMKLAEEEHLWIWDSVQPQIT